MRPFIGEPIAWGSLPVGEHRTLAYAEYGCSTGAPVVFVAGAASGALMSFGGPELERRGIRLISVDRPGLGASSPHAQKSFESVGVDIAALIAELGDGPVPVIANSQGAPFAMAAALAGAANRLILVSPSDEVALPALTAQLPASLRRLVETVTDLLAPDALSMFTSFTASAFFQMVLGDPAGVDATVYGDASFRTRFRAVVEAGFAQGSFGYAQDTVLAMSKWNLDLSAVRMPVDVLFGAEDIVHSPDRGEILSSRFPHATRRVIPGVGGSLLWARPELALDLCLS